jgi:hypothetical protein
MNAVHKISLPVLATLAAMAALGCSCKSKRSGSAGSQTVFVAADDGQASAATEESGAGEEAPPPPAEDPGLRTRLEEAVKQAAFAPFGPFSTVALEAGYATAAKRHLEGPGPCYVVLAACSVDAGSVSLRVLDGSKSAITLMPFGEGTLDPKAVAAGLVCPAAGGTHSFQVKSNAGSGQCSVAVLGN